MQREDLKNGSLSIGSAVSNSLIPNVIVLR